MKYQELKNPLNRQNGAFIERVYTKREMDYCESKKNAKYQHYAARFAAKEACFKAISEKFPKFELTWKDIEVINDENGRPSIHIGKNEPLDIESIDISLSHCKEYAVANVMVLFK